MEALNQKERRFAEENHGLIYSFMNYYRLPEEEYYDTLALAYLKAVQEYNRKPGLKQKYRFSTIAFQKMTDAKIMKYRVDQTRKVYTAFSLNALDSEGREYLVQLPDPHDALREADLQREMAELLQEVVTALTERQRSHLVKFLEGKSPQEIAREDHVSITDLWADRRSIRSAVTIYLGDVE